MMEILFVLGKTQWSVSIYVCSFWAVATVCCKCDHIHRHDSQGLRTGSNQQALASQTVYPGLCLCYVMPVLCITLTIMLLGNLSQMLPHLHFESSSSLSLLTNYFNF